MAAPMATTPTQVGLKWRMIGAGQHRHADAAADADARRPTRTARSPRAGTARAMSRGLAPSALRMPISRTRSDTLTSIMFMTPTPPTRSAMPAMKPTMVSHDRRTSASNFSMMPAKSKISKSSTPWCRSMRSALTMRLTMSFDAGVVGLEHACAAPSCTRRDRRRRPSRAARPRQSSQSKPKSHAPAILVGRAGR